MYESYTRHKYLRGAKNNDSMTFPQSPFLQVSIPRCSLRPSEVDHGALESFLRHTSSNHEKMNHTSRTMTEQDLTVGLGSSKIRARFGLTHFKVGFHIDVRTFLQFTKVIVRVRVKGMNVMPGSRGLRTTCRNDASVPQKKPSCTCDGHTTIGIKGRRWIIGRGNSVTMTGLYEMVCANRSSGAY